MTAPADAIERARATDILELARSYTTLKKVGGGEFAGPCPKCGGRDRFGLNVRKRLWVCRGCDTGGDVIALAQHVDGLSFCDAVERLADQRWTPTRIQAKAQKDAARDDPDYERRQHEKARWLWGQRRPLKGSIAEAYLRTARGYSGLPPSTLAFLPPLKPEYHPCLIAAFALHPGEVEPGVLVEPRDVQSVQLIALTSDGSGKADVAVNKRTIGAHKGLPIVVSPPNDGLGLSIHEGVEDALSAYEATGLGAWASGGATFLAALADAVPDSIEAVSIIGHRDDAGLLGARELARRLTKKGVDVLLEGGADG